MSAGARPSVLVGYSGFVGGNLLQRRHFDLLVNSANTEELRDGAFGEVVFSAARAEKWRANSDPDHDAAHITQLEDLMSSFTSERFTLISTVDVYGTPVDVDESTSVDTGGLHAYGLHRYRLEQAARRLHGDVLVARLPGLFGSGLKKNVVFDLLTDNEVQKIQPESSFQYYNLAHLSDDLEWAWRNALGLVNLVTEPVTTAAIVDAVFERSPLSTPIGVPAARYDVRTLHAGLRAAHSHYLYDRHAVLTEMREFVTAAQVGP